MQDIKLKEQMLLWRHYLHQHPELAFNEKKTSDYIAYILTENNIKIHQGMANTGIVATIKGKKTGKSIGLRADMDALKIQELNNFKHKSLHQGKMHACGHDGHCAMLLGAAVYLQKNNNFSGTVHFIFQPAEEGGAGAKLMIEQGLFEKFPCDEIYGMHNWPGIAVGDFVIHDAAVMAANETLEITIKGKGGHAAMPDKCIDPIIIGAQIINNIQSIISRNINPIDSAVISITIVQSGYAKNVIPDEMKLAGSIRYFKEDVGLRIRNRISQIAIAIAKSMRAEAIVQSTPNYPVTINSKKHAKKCIKAASMASGVKKIHRNISPSIASEDFSFMLNTIKGAYIWIGNGDNNTQSNCKNKSYCELHQSKYDFNDDILSIGASYWIQLVKNILN